MEDCDEKELDKLRSQLGMAPPESRGLDKYTLVGAGVGHDRDGFYTVPLFVYENEDVAQRNVEAFNKVLAEGYLFYSGKPRTGHFLQSEVWNDGRALIANLRTENPRTWALMVGTGESLLMWDE